MSCLGLNSEESNSYIGGQGDRKRLKLAYKHCYEIG
jgi:hypothetical protein